MFGTSRKLMKELIDAILCNESRQFPGYHYFDQFMVTYELHWLNSPTDAYINIYRRSLGAPLILFTAPIKLTYRNRSDFPHHQQAAHTLAVALGVGMLDILERREAGRCSVSGTGWHPNLGLRKGVAVLMTVLASRSFERGVALKEC